MHSPKVTEQRKQQLIKAVASMGNITAATRELKISRSAHYKWAREDPDYKQAIDDAYEEWVDSLESEAVRRGRDGWDEPVFVNGDLKNVKRRYSDQLLLALLKAHRSKLYRDRVEHSGDADAPMHTQLNVQYVDDWYGGSSEAAEAAETSAERAAELGPLQDADLRPEVGEDGDGPAGDA